MTKHVAFMSGNATFSPNMQEVIRQSIELFKLDIVQGLAFEKDGAVFKAQGLKKSPSKLGKIVADRVMALGKDSKRARPDYANDLPLQQLYTGELRDLARKHNVDLLSKNSVTKQADTTRMFSFVAPELIDADTIKTLHDNLFDSEIDADSARTDASVAIAAALPAMNVDPAIARMIAERSKAIDIAALLRGVGGNSSADNDDDAGGAPNAATSTIVLNRGLKFRLHRVKCLDETNPEWPGNDKIAAGGVAVNWDETTTTIPEFQVGSSFKDGSQKVYNPPRVLKTFSLNGAQYPADFMIAMALAEKDGGGLSKFITDLWEAIRDEVTVILTAVGAAAGAAAGVAIGGTFGTAVGGPIGTIIGVVAGAIVGALIGWLISALKDDIFEPQSAALRLPSANSTFTGGSLTSQLMSLNFRDHGGYYRAYYSWQITR